MIKSELRPWQKKMLAWKKKNIPLNPDRISSTCEQGRDAFAELCGCFGIDLKIPALAFSEEEAEAHGGADLCEELFHYVFQWDDYGLVRKDWKGRQATEWIYRSIVRYTRMNTLSLKDAYRKEEDQAYTIYCSSVGIPKLWDRIGELCYAQEFEEENGVNIILAMDLDVIGLRLFYGWRQFYLKRALEQLGRAMRENSDLSDPVQEMIFSYFGELCGTYAADQIEKADEMAADLMKLVRWNMERLAMEGISGEEEKDLQSLDAHFAA